MFAKLAKKIANRREQRDALRTYNAIHRVSDPRQMEELFAAYRR